jgi:hypothetical protein
MKIYRKSENMTLYHASPNDNLVDFYSYSHFGTLEQAEGRVISLVYDAEAIDEDINPVIYVVNISVKNTKTVNDVGDDSWGIEVRKAEEEGYDSLRYFNTEEGDGYSYVVFDPKNIKIIDKIMPNTKGLL